MKSTYFTRPFLCLLLFFFLNYSTILYSCDAFAGPDDSVCGFTYTLNGNPGNGTWGVYCDESANLVSIADPSSSFTEVTVAQCGFYQFVYTVIDATNCVAHDTIEIQFRDPSSAEYYINLDIQLEYDGVVCHVGNDPSCEFNNEVIIAGHPEPDFVWTFLQEGTCSSTIFTPNVIVGQGDSCSVDEINIITTTESGGSVTFNMNNQDEVTTDFSTYFDGIFNPFFQSLLSSCPLPNACPEDPACFQEVQDTIVYSIPIRAGGNWTYWQGDTLQIDLTDQTDIDIENETYLLSIIPGASYYGPGNITFSLLKYESTGAIVPAYGKKIKLQWKENIIYEPVEVYRTRVIPICDLEPCGGINIIYDGGDIPPPPPYPCGPIEISFGVEDPCIECVEVTAEIINPNFWDEVNCYQPWIELQGIGNSNYGPVDISWQFNSGSGTNLTVFNEGVYTLVVTDINSGCTATDEIHINECLWDPFIDAGNDKVLTCNEPCVTLDASIDYVWATSIFWDGPNGYTSFELNPEVCEPGTYNLTIMNECFCEGFDQVTITEDLVDPSIVAEPFEELTCQITCTTLSVTANSANGHSIEWFNSSGTSLANGDSHSVCFPGNYTAVVTDNFNGCTASVNLDVNEEVNHFINNISAQICEGEEFIINNVPYDETGIFTETIPNGTIIGCDSIIVLDLMVNSSLDSLIAETDTIIVCGFTYNLVGQIPGGHWGLICQENEDIVSLEEYTSDSIQVTVADCGYYQFYYELNNGSCTGIDTVDLLFLDPSFPIIDITTTIEMEYEGGTCPTGGEVNCWDDPPNLISFSGGTEATIKYKLNSTAEYSFINYVPIYNIDSVDNCVVDTMYHYTINSSGSESISSEASQDEVETGFFDLVDANNGNLLATILQLLLPPSPCPAPPPPDLPEPSPDCYIEVSKTVSYNIFIPDGGRWHILNPDLTPLNDSTEIVIENRNFLFILEPGAQNYGAGTATILEELSPNYFYYPFAPIDVFMEWVPKFKTKEVIKVITSTIDTCTIDYSGISCGGSVINLETIIVDPPDDECGPIHLRFGGYPCTCDGAFVEIYGNNRICDSETTQLTAEYYGWDIFPTYYWSTGEYGPTITVSEPGVYTAFASDQFGCIDEESFEVIVDEPPHPIITGPPLFCMGSSATLTTGSYDSYQWSNGWNSQSISVNETGIYYVTVSDSNACSGEASFQIEENSALLPSISGLLNFCSNGSTTLNVPEDFSTYLWSNNETSSSISVNTAGEYSVTVTDELGCTGAEMVIVTTSSNAPPQIINQDSIVCGFEYTLMAQPPGGTWGVICSESADTVSFTEINGDSMQVTVSSCGYYQFYYDLDDDNCGGRDTIEILFQDPSTLVIDLSSDIGVDYNDYGCPSGGATDCNNPSSNSISFSGQTEPAFIWSFNNSAICESNIYETTTFGNSDSCAVDNISIQINNTKDTIFYTITESQDVVVNDFLGWTNDLNNNLLDSILGLCQVPPICPAPTPSSPDCFTEVRDTNYIEIPIREGGLWHLRQGANNYLPLSDSTEFGYQNRTLLLILNPGADYYGPGPIEATIFEKIGFNSFVEPHDPINISIQWIEEIRYDTIVQIVDLTLDTCAMNLPCGGIQINSGSSIGGPSPYDCGPVDLSFGGYPCPCGGAFVDIFGDDNICPGESAQIIAFGVDFTGYYWSTGEFGPSISVTQPGVYSVVASNSSGCQAENSFVVTENEIPVVDIDGPLTFCQDGTATLTSSIHQSYIWSDNTFNQSISVSSTGTYGVTVSNSVGCTNQAQFYIEENSPLMPSISGLLNFCSNGSTTLNVPEDFSTYLWSNNETSSSISVNTAGEYSVTVTDELGCTGAEMVIVTTSSNAPPQIINQDSIVCGFEYTLMAQPPGGTWGVICSESADTVSFTEINVDSMQVTVSSCGYYQFYYDLDDDDCGGRDTIEILFQDPSTIVIDISSDIEVDYNDYGCPTGGSSNCWNPSSNSISFSGQTAPALIWSFNNSAICESNIYETITNGNGDSCVVDNISIQINNTKDTISYTIMETQEVVVNDFLGWTNDLNNFLLDSILGECQIPPICPAPTPSSPDCFTQVRDTNYIEIPIREGGLWHLRQGSNNYLPLSDSTEFNYQNRDFLFILNPGADYYGPGQIEATIFEKFSPTLYDMPYDPILISLEWIENIRYDTIVQIVDLTLDTCTMNLPCGGIQINSGSSIGGPSPYDCGPVNLFFESFPCACPPVQVDIIGDNLICEGSSTTLDVIVQGSSGIHNVYWSTTGETSSSITVNSGGIYTVQVYDDYDCYYSTSFLLEEEELPIPEIEGSTTFCTGGSTLLSVGSYENYIWSNGSTDQFISAEASGIYGVTVTSSNGCTGIDEIEVIQDDQLAPTISGDLDFCSGGMTTLNAGSGFDTYLWSNDSTTSEIIVTTGGEYSVTVEDDSGCSGTASVTVIEAADEQVEITSQDTIVCGFTYTLVGQPTGGYWGIICQESADTISFQEFTSDSVQVTVASCGYYQFFYELDNGICSDRDTIEILFRDPSTTDFSSFVDIQLDYNDYGCHEGGSSNCLDPEPNVITIAGQIEPEFIWSFYLNGMCESNLIASQIIGAVDSCVADQIDFTTITSSDSDTSCIMEPQEVVLGDFFGFLDGLHSDLFSGMLSQCPLPPLCPLPAPLPPECILTTVDTTFAYLPRRLGGQWNYLQNDTLLVPLNDSTIIDVDNQNYLFIIDPNANYYGPDPITFTIFEELTASNYALPIAPVELMLQWVEHITYDTVMRVNVMNIDTCAIGCGGLSFNVENSQIPEPPNYECGPITLSFGGGGDVCSCLDVWAIASSTPIELGCDICVELNGDGGSSNGPVDMYWEGFGVNPVMVCEPGNYTFTVIDLATGCNTSESIFVNIEPSICPPLFFDAGQNQMINCDNPCAILQPNLDQSFSYTWQGPGSFTSNEMNPTVCEPGIYSLNVIGNCNCPYNANVEVIGGDLTPPIADAGMNKTIDCQNECVQLEGAFDADQAVDFLWTGPDGFVSSELSPNVCEVGWYTLSVFEPSSGCEDISEVMVSEEIIEILSILNEEICAGECYTLDNMTYCQSGSYTNTITNWQGCDSTIQLNLIVSELFIQMSEIDIITCNNPTSTLDASASFGDGLNFFWTTSDGNILGNPNSPIIEVDQAGNYTLIIENGLCNQIETINVIDDLTLPIVNAGADLEINCQNNCVNLQGQASVNNILWTGPNGFSSTDLQAEVCLSGWYILEVFNDTNGCISKDSTIVIDGVISLSSEVNANICEYDCYTMGTEEFCQPGIYNITLVSSKGCDSIVNLNIEMISTYIEIETPLALDCNHELVTLDANQSMSGPNVNYTWYSPDGHIVGNPNGPTIEVNESGTYQLTLSNNGCSNTANVTVVQNIDTLIADAGIDLFLDCNSHETHLAPAIEGLDQLAIEWTGPDGFVSQDPNPSVDHPGLYMLTLTHLISGCTAADVVKVEMDAPIIFEVDPGVSCLEMSTGSLTVGNISAGLSPYRYALNNQTFQASPDFELVSSGEHTVYVMDDLGCIQSQEINIQHYDPIAINLDDLYQTCADNAIFLSAIDSNENDTGALNFLWSDGSTDAVRPFTLSGDYWVEVSNECETIHHDFTIINEFEPLKDLFYIPNAFSPNGDSNNDEFKIEATIPIAEFEILIFDRWGNNVFGSKDIQKGWNGKLKGRRAPIGVYVWWLRIKFETCNGEDEIFLEGDLTLLR